MYVAVHNTSSIHGFLEFIATAGILEFSGPPHVVVACMCCVNGNGIRYSGIRWVGERLDRMQVRD